MFTRQHIVFVSFIALTMVSITARAQTADEIRQRAQASAVPVIISGRIVTDTGQPLPGVRMTILPQVESSSLISLPVVKPFNNIPSICFDMQTTGIPTVVTDANGRYSYSAMFMPDMPSNFYNPNERCAQYRNKLTAANSGLVPSPLEAANQNYNFERDTRTATAAALGNKAGVTQVAPGMGTAPRPAIR